MPLFLLSMDVLEWMYHRENRQLSYRNHQDIRRSTARLWSRLLETLPPDTPLAETYLQLLTVRFWLVVQILKALTCAGQALQY